MSKLEDLYKEKMAQYNEYQNQKIAYDTRISDYINRIKKQEQVLKTKIDNLPSDIREAIDDILPDLSVECNMDNVRSRLQAWRNVYTTLEKVGLNLLND
jgi:hypothetical protein